VSEIADSVTDEVVKGAMTDAEVDTLAKIREAMKDPNASVRPVLTFTHGMAAQVYVKSRKIGPVICTTEGQTLGDVFKMLGDFAAGVEPTEPKITLSKGTTVRLDGFDWTIYVKQVGAVFTNLIDGEQTVHVTLHMTRPITSQHEETTGATQD